MHKKQNSAWHYYWFNSSLLLCYSWVSTEWQICSSCHSHDGELSRYLYTPKPVQSGWTSPRMDTSSTHAHFQDASPGGFFPQTLGWATLFAISSEARGTLRKGRSCEDLHVADFPGSGPTRTEVARLGCCFPETHSSLPSMAHFLPKQLPTSSLSITSGLRTTWSQKPASLCHTSWALDTGWSPHCHPEPVTELPGALVCGTWWLRFMHDFVLCSALLELTLQWRRNASTLHRTTLPAFHPPGCADTGRKPPPAQLFPLKAFRKLCSERCSEDSIRVPHLISSSLLGGHSNPRG